MESRQGSIKSESFGAFFGNVLNVNDQAADRIIGLSPVFDTPSMPRNLAGGRT